MAMAEEVYTLKGVSHFYGDVAALNGIDLSLRSGETVSFLGANGSGKSTLLKVLDGLIFPSSGSVLFCGSPVKKDGNSSLFRQRVGFVFHEPDVQLFSPTVYEEVSFGPLQLGLTKAEVRKRADDILNMLSIEGLKERLPYTLSSGEKKKVAIASVLTVNPDVLLLDEPTNGLDPRTQVWLMELLATLRKLKKTCIIATHDLSLAFDVSDRVVVLNESHSIAADGPPGPILADKELLLRTNLIHEHAHRHGNTVHAHSHGPFSTHDEHD